MLNVPQVSRPSLQNVLRDSRLPDFPFLGAGASIGSVNLVSATHVWCFFFNSHRFISWGIIGYNNTVFKTIHDVIVPREIHI